MQIATEGDAGRLSSGLPVFSRLFLQVLASRFHAPTVVLLPRSQGADETKLSRRRGLAGRLQILAARYRTDAHAGSQHALPGGQGPAAKVPGGPNVGRDGAMGGVGAHLETVDQAVGVGQHLLRIAPRQPPLRTAMPSNPPADARKDAEKGRSRTRAQTVRRMPKLAVGVASHCHLALSLWTGTGAGADHPHFEPLVFDAWRRVPYRRFTVVADAGYDSEEIHELARQDMGLRSIIPPKIGRPRPRKQPPGGRWRRHMMRLLHTKTSRRKCGYTRRWQVETVNSMMKRNLGSSLRGKTAWSRKRDMALKTLTHNLMILRPKGSRQSRSLPKLTAHPSTWDESQNPRFNFHPHASEVKKGSLPKLTAHPSTWDKSKSTRFNFHPRASDFNLWQKSHFANPASQLSQNALSMRRTCHPVILANSPKNTVEPAMLHISSPANCNMPCKSRNTTTIQTLSQHEKFANTNPIVKTVTKSNKL